MNYTSRVLSIGLLLSGFAAQAINTATVTCPSIKNNLKNNEGVVYFAVDAAKGTIYNEGALTTKNGTVIVSKSEGLKIAGSAVQGAFQGYSRVADKDTVDALKNAASTATENAAITAAGLKVAQATRAAADLAAYKTQNVQLLSTVTAYLKRLVTLNTAVTDTVATRGVAYAWNVVKGTFFKKASHA